MTSRYQKPSNWKRKLLIIIPFAITGTFLASMYLYFTLPVYETTAVLKAKPYTSNKSSLSILADEKSPATEELTSPQFIANSLQGSAALIQCFVNVDGKTSAVNYSFPYLITFQPAGNPNYNPQHYVIRPLTGESFTLRSTIHGVTRIKTARYGEEIKDNNLILTIRKKDQTTPIFHLIKKAEFSFTIHSPSSLTADLITNDQIRAKESNGIIYTSIRSANPEHAALIANSVSGMYVNGNATNLTAGNNQTDSDIIEVGRRISEAEVEIARYKQANHLTDLAFDTEKDLSLLKELQMQKAQLEIQMSSLDNLSKYLRKNRDADNSQVEYGSITDPHFIEHINQLNLRYQQKSKGKSTPELDQEIEVLKSIVAERILQTRKKIAVQIDQINTSLAQTQQRLNKIPEQATALAAMERNMQLDKKVYDLMINRKADALVQGTAVGGQGAIIRQAPVPVQSVWPINWLVLLAGALAGTIMGLGVIRLVKQSENEHVHNIDELTGISKIPFIATVYQGGENTRFEPTSVGNLCTAMLMKPNQKVVTFASGSRGEGKTHVSTTVAHSLAALDKKVLLMDMNLSNPEISTCLQVAPQHTLSDVLAGSCDIHDAICITSFPNLDVLAPGTLLSGMSRLVASGQHIAIIDMLKQHYDYILIDTNSLNENNDAVPMMNISDLNLFITRANTTRKSSVMHAEKLRDDMHIKNLHLVMNSNNAPVLVNSKRNKSTAFQRKRASVSTMSGKPTLLRRIALWFY
jgi:capsular exopolysaccharide synthesis family protein